MSRGSVAVASAPVSSFDAAVASYGQLNSAVSGGSSVTVCGLSFGVGEHSVSTALSEALCVTSSWTSATVLSCLSRAAMSLQDPLFATMTVEGHGNDRNHACVI
jgi:hypothetical protein